MLGFFFSKKKKEKKKKKKKKTTTAAAATSTTTTITTKTTIPHIHSVVDRSMGSITADNNRQQAGLSLSPTEDGKIISANEPV